MELPIGVGSSDTPSEVPMKHKAAGREGEIGRSTQLLTLLGISDAPTVRRKFRQDEFSSKKNRFGDRIDLEILIEFACRHIRQLNSR